MRRDSLVAIAAAGIIATACQRAAPYDVYVTNERSGDLTVIDGATEEVVGSIPLGKRPRGIEVGPDGTQLFVALSGSPIAGPGVDESTLPPADKEADGIGIVDLAARRLVKILHAGSDPEQVSLSADGSKLYASNEDMGMVSVVDVTTGAILTTVPVGGEPEGVTTSPDGRLVYVTSEADGQVTAIATATDQAIRSFAVGPRPRSCEFLADSSRAFCSLENGAAVAVVDTTRHALVRTVAIPGQGAKPMGLALAPDGKRLYVTTGRGGTLVVLDVATFEVVATVPVGPRPWGVAVSPDGRRVYTANGPSGDVSVVDTASLTVVRKVRVGDGPWGVAIRGAVRAGRTRSTLVAVEDAYHGNSLGTLSIGSADNRQQFPNLLANCRRLAPPLDERAAARLETMLAKRDVAAFVFEPVACNLGVMVPEQGFVDRLRELCSRYGTVLVADEVACGFGRTGTLFACERFGLEPDVLCLGKAITGGYAAMGATLISEALARQVGNDVEIWSTFGWHPRSVAAALAVLRLWESEGAALLARVAETSALFEQRLLGMALEPAQLHVQGLAIALDIDDEQRVAAVARRAREHGLLVSAEGGSLGLWPALDIPRETAEEGLDILGRCLAEIGAKGRKRDGAPRSVSKLLKDKTRETGRGERI